MVRDGGQWKCPEAAAGRGVSPTSLLLSAFETTLAEGVRMEKRLFYATFATVSRGLSSVWWGQEGGHSLP